MSDNFLRSQISQILGSSAQEFRAQFARALGSQPQLHNGRYRNLVVPASAAIMVLGSALVPGAPMVDSTGQTSGTAASGPRTSGQQQSGQQKSGQQKSTEQPSEDNSALARGGPGESRSADRAKHSDGAKTAAEPKPPAEAKPESKSESNARPAAKSNPQASASRGGSSGTRSGSTNSNSSDNISAQSKEIGTNTRNNAGGAGPDAKGIQPSVYTGGYYRPEYEAFRRCVVHRESRGDYTVRNSSSGASGAYQFMLGTSNEVARMMDRPDLIGRPAGTWTRAEQDEAFYTLYNHGRGASHWGGSCR